ncbi:hypothetical protein Tco_0623832 [Tanacetum coccineum]|uniref:PiggyBac transposable element-derived protein domain-containing protein n=1 Tax=Tanacetum coccineum TaxID=301880 RepID=A0ABQ4WCC7_9ASTR
MWCCEHHAEITVMVNDTTHVLIQSQELQREDVATLCGWMLLLRTSNLKAFFGNFFTSTSLLQDTFFRTKGKDKCTRGHIEIGKHPEEKPLWSQQEYFTRSTKG